MELKDKTILIISPNDWGGMRVSKHHYAEELSKLGNKVYFLNPPSLKGPFLTISQLGENLYNIQYYPIFRGKSFLPSTLFNRLIKLQIKLIERKIGEPIDILWSFTTTNYFNLLWFNAKFRIFHPVDQINNNEARDIANTADIVFTCSEYILGELQGIKKEKKMIPHGVASSFLNVKSGRSNLFYDLGKINVGYAGNLFAQNLDRAVIREILNTFKQVTFHFYGAFIPSESNVSAHVNKETLEFSRFLENAPNVHCHGVVPSVSLPHELNKMDAFFVCYSQSEYNKISNSHKILEYLSIGKVIISTNVEFYKNSTLVEMCSSNSEFKDLFKDVIENIDLYNTEEKIKQRVKYASNNSYRSNIREIERTISRL